MHTHASGGRGVHTVLTKKGCAPSSWACRCAHPCWASWVCTLRQARKSVHTILGAKVCTPMLGVQGVQALKGEQGVHQSIRWQGVHTHAGREGIVYTMLDERRACTWYLAVPVCTPMLGVQGVHTVLGDNIYAHEAERSGCVHPCWWCKVCTRINAYRVCTNPSGGKVCTLMLAVDGVCTPC